MTDTHPQARKAADTSPTNRPLWNITATSWVHRTGLLQYGKFPQRHSYTCNTFVWCTYVDLCVTISGLSVCRLLCSKILIWLFKVPTTEVKKRKCLNHLLLSKAGRISFIAAEIIDGIFVSQTEECSIPLFSICFGSVTTVWKQSTNMNGAECQRWGETGIRNKTGVLTSAPSGPVGPLSPASPTTPCGGNTSIVS